MKLRRFVEELLNRDIQTAEQVSGGRDSTVWRIEVRSGQKYAVRVLPEDRLNQFIFEKDIMEHARHYGIAVPKPIAVQAGGGSAVMVMEWGRGRTLLEELQLNPLNSERIGYLFGAAQAGIHNIPSVSCGRRWLEPMDDEERILMESISGEISPSGGCLLHLDYHPLNVMTDGEGITAILDWANSSAGDWRFDTARTHAILELLGHGMMEAKVLDPFIAGWKMGYLEAAGTTAGDNPLFYVWSGARLSNDLGPALPPGVPLQIEAWTRLHLQG
ncbi:phosphotransferase family protein [Peribacillus sp. SCS-37]|uniref:phosphotransferase family protein n=1 Tax=Paraperibacillus esterisolvens TaxID=3115296 RepID=UPI00390649F9